MTDQQANGRDRGGGPDLSAARREAERLVATGLAALSLAADRIGAPSRPRGGAAAAGYDALGDMLFGPARRHTVANGSDACCHCPVCRLIAAARNPSPELAERLASGAGLLAEQAARVLRAVAGAGGDAGRAEPRERSTAGADQSEVGDPWAAATAESGPATE
ncbi:MAG TPA: hypothetical protein VKZ67_10925 [Natronosporangium sp.]|nr:hypothetical protein [Natronosporangium sp.]